MKLSKKHLQQFSETYFEGKNAVHNYISGMTEIGIPRIFYCGWIENEKDKKQVQTNYPNCCFNHRVGLPTRQWEGDEYKVEEIPVELTGVNKRMMDNYHKHRKYSMNKCRGSGATEILTIRWMIFKYAILNEGKNRKGVIIPGTSSKLSKEISTRIKTICDKIPQIYQKVPSSEHPEEFLFSSGGKITLTSATADAIRGWTNVGDLILEEVAHWDMIDDIPVYMSSESVHSKTLCHVVHSTTPRQKRGFYYNLIWDETATSSYYKHTTNWREVVGLPVPHIEDLQKFVQENGKITNNDMKTMRKQLKDLYKTDPEYKMWFNNFFHGIKFDDIIDVPIPLLDVNSIVDDSITYRPEYDQELDNLFIATDSRAFGDFIVEDFDPLDLRKQIETFEEAIQWDKGHHGEDDINLTL